MTTAFHPSRDPKTGIGGEQLIAIVGGSSSEPAAVRGTLVIWLKQDQLLCRRLQLTKAQIQAMAGPRWAFRPRKRAFPGSTSPKTGRQNLLPAIT